MLGRQAMPGEERRYAQRESLVAEQARREIDRDAEIGAALVDRRRCRNRFLEHEVGELADPVVLLRSRDELGSCDRPFFRMGPTGQRFRSDDPARP